MWICETGLTFHYFSSMSHFQTLHLKDYEMASIIEGKLTWNIVQWVALAEQHFLQRMLENFGIGLNTILI